jgi:hypothetical protein
VVEAGGRAALMAGGGGLARLAQLGNITVAAG